MRCKEFRAIVWEAETGKPAEGVKQHLEACAACQSYLADFSTLRAGLSALGREDAPPASWGFSDRVLRRLKQEKNRGVAAAPEFLESAGRRVILATLVLVFTLLLAMILPSSGPVRHRPSLDTYWSQTEAATATTVSYPVEYTSVPPVPILVDVKPAVFRGNR